jgi:hypothetical protein
MIAKENYTLCFKNKNRRVASGVWLNLKIDTLFISPMVGSEMFCSLINLLHISLRNLGHLGVLDDLAKIERLVHNHRYSAIHNRTSYRWYLRRFKNLKKLTLIHEPVLPVKKGEIALIDPPATRAARMENIRKMHYDSFIDSHKKRHPEWKVPEVEMKCVTRGDKLSLPPTRMELELI